MGESTDITELLSRLRGDGGSSDARVIDRLMPLVYAELKQLAVEPAGGLSSPSA